MLRNSTLLILSLVVVINAVSYGVIIPLLYPYAVRFGINAVVLGLLFASFSFFQFLATPILGRLSDRYGRKPLLFLSLLGSCFSLALLASAQTAAMLFVARSLDGITGGNMSIAQAMIADTTDGQDRAKGMGKLGAAFGFGFLLGPASAALLAPLGLTAPFWLASGLALAAAALTLFVLPETLAKGTATRAVHREPFFDPGKTWRALRLPGVGGLLGLSFVSSIAHFGLVIGFQAYAVDVMRMTAPRLGLLFTGFGIVNTTMQLAGVAILLRLFKSKLLILKLLLVGTTITSSLFTISTSLWFFAAISLIYGVFFTSQPIVIVGAISESTRQEDQGVMLGINQSIQSFGQIIGPLVAGGVTLALGVGAVFPVTGLIFLAAVLSAWSLRPARVKADV